MNFVSLGPLGDPLGALLGLLWGLLGGLGGPSGRLGLSEARKGNHVKHIENTMRVTDLLPLWALLGILLERSWGFLGAS